MTKSEIRSKYQSQRDKLSQENIDELSIQIANKSLELDIWNKTYYHLFLPIANKKEINTEYILQILQGKDKEIVLPRSNFETNEMTNILLTDNTRIKVNNYGIPEPINGLEVPSKTIEVVFIPLLAFDSKGHRIGYGKGFYDRFLSQCNPDVVKIGLSFFTIELTDFESLDTDMPLDYCVTPQKIFQF
jgi:5-formyltetrahydrofolate cyclo-ligase